MNEMRGPVVFLTRYRGMDCRPCDEQLQGVVERDRPGCKVVSIDDRVHPGQEIRAKMRKMFLADNTPIAVCQTFFEDDDDILSTSNQALFDGMKEELQGLNAGLVALVGPRGWGYPSKATDLTHLLDSTSYAEVPRVTYSIADRSDVPYYGERQAGDLLQVVDHLSELMGLPTPKPELESA